MSKTPDMSAIIKDAMATFPFGVTSLTGAFQSTADLNEKINAVALDAASKSLDVSTQWSKDALAGLSDMSAAKSQPTDYARAMSVFASSYSKAATAHMMTFAEIAKKAQTDAIGVMTNAGENLTKAAPAAIKPSGQKAAKPAKATGKPVTDAAKPAKAGVKSAKIAAKPAVNTSAKDAASAEKTAPKATAAAAKSAEKPASSTVSARKKAATSAAKPAPKPASSTATTEKTAAPDVNAAGKTAALAGNPTEKLAMNTPAKTPAEPAAKPAPKTAAATAPAKTTTRTAPAKTAEPKSASASNSARKAKTAAAKTTGPSK